MPPRRQASRYGIAEWYGRDIITMTPKERQDFGAAACKHEDSGGADAPLCPYLSKLVPNARCNKAGGVCSIRKFNAAPDGKTGIPTEADSVVTSCPLRFVDHLADGKFVTSWVAEHMLDIPNPTIVKETPFLRKVSDSIRPPEAKLIFGIVPALV